MDPRIVDGDDDKQRQHHCKVCGRGFSCAGALGGHMRAHDHVVALESEPEPGPETGNRHSYFLRAKGLSRYGEECNKLGESCDFGVSNEDQDLADCLVMLSNRSYTKEGVENKVVVKDVGEKSNIFQCKACKKVFNSHQALGGHRASHKKVKGCFAAKSSSIDTIGGANEENDESITPEDHRKRAKMHECSVCLRVFSSGQALGGHKRCHWLTTTPIDTSSTSFAPNHNLDLNLNLPAPTRIHSQGDRTGSSNATRSYVNQILSDHKPKNTQKLSDLKKMQI